jgi:hypothetical protein
MCLTQILRYLVIKPTLIVKKEGLSQQASLLLKVKSSEFLSLNQQKQDTYLF